MWYVVIDGSRKGPMEKEAVVALLRSGNATSESPVWRAGMKEWTALNRLPEFASVVGAQAPAGKLGASSDAAASVAAGQEAARERSDEPPPHHLTSTDAGPRRDFALVCVVFFWAIGGVGGIIAGGLLMGGVGFAEGSSEALSGIVGRGSPGVVKLILEFVGFVGALVWLCGLLFMVACYGLWTCQRWGLPLARILAVVYVSIGALGVIVSLVMRVQIVVSLVGLGLSIVILRYFYGSGKLRDYFQRYSGVPRDGGGARED